MSDTRENLDARQPSAVEVARLEERVTALTRSVQDRFEANEKQTALAMSAAEKAVTKAETASEKRFEGVNEFRAVLTDQAKTLITRTEVDILIKGLNDRVDTSVKSAIDKIEGPNGIVRQMNNLALQVNELTSRMTGKEEGSHQSTNMQVWLIGLTVAVLGLLAALFIKH